MIEKANVHIDNKIQDGESELEFVERMIQRYKHDFELQEDVAVICVARTLAKIYDKMCENDVKEEGK